MRRHVYIAGGAIAVVLIVAGFVLSAQLRRSRLRSGLRDPSPAVRLAAIRSLDTDSDVELLLVSLRDEDADVRLVTAWQLGGRGSQAERRAGALIEALRDPHAGVRRAAAESLWSLGPASTPGLIAALKDDDPRVRAEAAFALQSWLHKEQRQRAPGEAEAIRPLLEDLLHDEDAAVRRRAEETLGQLR
jgi:HEAT repeat protein